MSFHPLGFVALLERKQCDSDLCHCAIHAESACRTWNCRIEACEIESYFCPNVNIHVNMPIDPFGVVPVQIKPPVLGSGPPNPFGQH